MRLYRGLKEPYRPEKVSDGQKGPPGMFGTDFSDDPHAALRYANGRRGVVLVLDLPKDDEDGRLRVTQELWGLRDDGPKRFMVWGRFDEFVVAEIPAKELRKHVRAKGVVTAEDEYKAMVLAQAIEDWIANADVAASVAESSEPTARPMTTTSASSLAVVVSGHDQPPSPRPSSKRGSTSLASNMIVKTAFVGSSMQLRVELRHLAPSIWRRLVVPAELTLDGLHDVLQVAFGWKDSHLHDFHVADVRFGMSDVEDELLLVDERAAPIGAIACQGAVFRYRYDFGDDWEHDITVETISEPGPDPVVIECLEGARSCPPEDCGGPPGYENLLRVLADPNDEEHRDMKRWVGRGFDPEKFDLDKMNKKLRTIGRRLERQAQSARGRRRGR